MSFPGGEARASSLATERSAQAQRGRKLYVLESRHGLTRRMLRPMLVQVGSLVDAGNYVVMIEHDMRAVAKLDWDARTVGQAAGRCRRQHVVGVPLQQRLARKVWSRSRSVRFARGCAGRVALVLPNGCQLSAGPLIRAPHGGDGSLPESALILPESEQIGIVGRYLANTGPIFEEVSHAVGAGTSSGP